MKWVSGWIGYNFYEIGKWGLILMKWVSGWVLKR